MNEKVPHQFEFILDQFQNLKVLGGNLVGDIDFMFGRTITLLPKDEFLKTIFVVKPSVVATDTNGTTVEMEVEVILNIYKNDFPFTASDLYGLFCYAYISSYHVFKSEIGKKDILHNGEIYQPTMTIPSYEMVSNEILQELKRVYG